MGVRASFIELFSRVVKALHNDEKIYINGANNLYPNEIERIINSSPTAKRCVNVMMSYIYGKGIDEGADILINKRKNYTLSTILKKIIKSYTYQGGAFIHIGYGWENGKIVIKSLDVLDYTKCRISKEDDKDSKGKIYYDNYEKKWSYLSGYSQERKWYYPFNNNQEVLKAQLLNDFSLNKRNKKDTFSLERAISDFRGQVYFFNPSDYIYPLSFIDPAYNDADSEHRISIYTNTQSRLAFLGKLIMVCAGLEKEEKEKIQNDFSRFLGSENSGGVYRLDVEAGQNLEDAVKFIQLDAQYDDKLFENTDKRIIRNILGVFKNLPEGLAFSSDAIFSNSGESYREMQRFYNQQTFWDRDEIEKTFKILGFKLKINPLIDE
ncbi:hypothetical protein ETU09_08165 [Apibacter muscae]|uniref:Phage portal protein n=1 Tax=Apibacter muscae TaxID=2509004 RepID=A0A563DA46_9FLAO|nr:hypothetical protein [Apibacter muscae]TWP27085.1 hypothetical protein ETU09_08165 [Apibacter muscae]